MEKKLERLSQDHYNAELKRLHLEEGDVIKFRKPFLLQSFDTRDNKGYWLIPADLCVSDKSAQKLYKEKTQGGQSLSDFERSGFSDLEGLYVAENINTTSSRGQGDREDTSTTLIKSRKLNKEEKYDLEGRKLEFSIYFGEHSFISPVNIDKVRKMGKVFV